MKVNKPWYKKWGIWLLGAFVTLCLLSIPFIINGAYLNGTGDGSVNTVFSASDLILFYGSFLAFLGTVALGALALWQNKIANKQNEKFAKVQMANFLSFVALINSSVKYCEKDDVENNDYEQVELCKLNTRDYLAVKCSFNNTSNYPITIIKATSKLFVNDSENKKDAVDNEFYTKLILKDHHKENIYIGEKSDSNIVFKLSPYMARNSTLSIHFEFTNACGFSTSSTLTIDLNSNTIKSYRITTFKDLNP